MRRNPISSNWHYIVILLGSNTDRKQGQEELCWDHKPSNDQGFIDSILCSILRPKIDLPWGKVGKHFLTREINCKWLGPFKLLVARFFFASTWFPLLVGCVPSTQARSNLKRTRVDLPSQPKSLEEHFSRGTSYSVEWRRPKGGGSSLMYFLMFTYPGTSQTLPPFSSPRLFSRRSAHVKDSERIGFGIKTDCDHEPWATWPRLVAKMSRNNPITRGVSKEEKKLHVVGDAFIFPLTEREVHHGQLSSLGARLIFWVIQHMPGQDVIICFLDFRSPLVPWNTKCVHPLHQRGFSCAQLYYFESPWFQVEAPLRKKWMNPTDQVDR